MLTRTDTRTMTPTLHASEYQCRHGCTAPRCSGGSENTVMLREWIVEGSFSVHPSSLYEYSKSNTVSVLLFVSKATLAGCKSPCTYFNRLSLTRNYSENEPFVVGE